MKWETITLLKDVKTGTDELGNDVTEPLEVYTSKARFTPAEDVRTALDGRDVSSNETFFTLPIKSELVPEHTQIKYNGVTYKSLDIAALSPRWTIIRAVVYETRTTRAGSDK